MAAWNYSARTSFVIFSNRSSELDLTTALYNMIKMIRQYIRTKQDKAVQSKDSNKTPMASGFMTMSSQIFIFRLILCL